MARIAIRVIGSRRTRSPAPEGTTTGEGRRRPIVHEVIVRVTSARVTIADRARPGGRGSPRPTRARTRPEAGERTDRPWRPKPDQARGDKPWRPKPPGSGQSDRPWRPKPPGSGPATGPGGQSRRAIRATDRGGQSRPTRASSVRGSRSRRRRSGTRTGPAGKRPWQPKPARPDQRAWTPKPEGGDRPWRPKPPGDRGDKPWRPKPPGGAIRPAVAAQASRRRRRETLAAQAAIGRHLAARSRGGPSRIATAGRATNRGGPKPAEGRRTRPPREKEDQGPPNDRSPREERGRKGGTRLVKKVRR